MAVLLVRDGSVWTFGDNQQGQLGYLTSGPAGATTTPSPGKGGSGVSGSHSKDAPLLATSPHSKGALAQSLETRYLDASG